MAFLTFDLGQPADRPDVVALDPREVVLALGVEQPEDRVGVALAVHVRHPEVVPVDDDVPRALPLALELGVGAGVSAAEGQEGQ